MRKTFSWAMRKLRQPGARLVLSHTPRINQKYTIAPLGGPIRDDVAKRILKEKSVVPCDHGLFPETPQSWTLRS